MRPTGLLGVLLGIGCAALGGAEPPPTFPYPRPLPEPSAAKLPRWRGFNLLYKFNAQAAPTPERVMDEDFRLIASLGFNFVRIPLDYRGWIVGGDWERIDEAKLREIDQIVALGGKYGLHVALNFHRAPGYTVAQPAESRSLWTDMEAQRVCAQHWAEFARRYRGIPNSRLSFNLFNEPAGVVEADYLAVVQKIAEAIRREDPTRLILCDGLDYGNVPPLALRRLGVGLMTRGYRPMNIRHFRASWIAGADRWPTPDWPTAQVSAFLYGPAKRDLQSSLVMTGPLGGKILRLHVDTVSSRAKVRATAGDGAILWEHDFRPGPGEGEWKKVVLRPEWNSYANVYDRDYPIPLPPIVKRVELRLIEGDWLTLSAITVDGATTSQTLTLVNSWGMKQTGEVEYTGDLDGAAFRSVTLLDRRWLRDACYGPWHEAQKAGLGVMIGEMGAFRLTPHPVVLRWMEDLLATAQDENWGWALWEFRGPFGVLDSQRTDVTYEPWEGHALDLPLLDLLQKY